MRRNGIDVVEMVTSGQTEADVCPRERCVVGKYCYRPQVARTEALSCSDNVTASSGHTIVMSMVFRYQQHRR